MEQENKQFKMLSLFDGSGGFPLAASMCGIEPVACSEIEPFPIKVTKARFPNMKHLGDISEINGADLEPVDVVTGGSPCQSLSQAGKRDGMSKKCLSCGHLVIATEESDICPKCGGTMAYTRSGLFMEQIRVIKEMRERDYELGKLRSRGTNEHIRSCRFMLWENVTGALSSNRGDDFRAVLEETARIVDKTATIPRPKNGKWNTDGCIMGNGYSIAWRVLDAQYWGVPQRRRRIALVADFAGQCAGEILFKREGLSRNFTESKKAWQGITRDFTKSIGETGESCIGFDSYNLCETGRIGRTVTTPSGGLNEHIPCVIEPQYSVDFGRTADRIQMNADKAVTLLGEGGGCGAKTGLYCLPKKSQTLDLEMEVMVRKYEVDKEKLCATLRDAKAEMKLSNKDIATVLEQPLTLVEHWFRNDSSFAIPQPEIWENLKKLLNIQTDEFDKSIMEFEYKPSEYDMRNRIHIGEVEATLTTNSKEDKYLLPIHEPYVMNERQYACTITQGIANTLTGTDYKGTQCVFEPKCFNICAYNSNSMKSDNPNSGIYEAETSRTLDLNGGNPACNQGGLMICESVVAIEGNGSRPSHKGDGYKESDVMYTLNATEQHGVAYGYRNSGFAEYISSSSSSTLKAQGGDLGGGSETLITEQKSYQDKTGTLMDSGYDKLGTQETMNDMFVANEYIVRRLTPLECSRLQGFPDTWLENIAIENPTEEDLIFWREVFETHRKLVTGAAKPKTDKQIIKWLKEPDTDGAKYKLWGNGISLPCFLYVMEGIKKVLDRTATETHETTLI